MALTSTLLQQVFMTPEPVEGARALDSKLYRSLHELARRRMRDERPGHVLQPTALLHEAWIRLALSEGVEDMDQEAYLSMASIVVRRVLVDDARKRDARKRGGDVRRAPLPSSSLVASQSNPVDVLDLHEALERLAGLHERQARIVELRFFGGLEVAAIARQLGVSTDTVKRDWRMARAWLHRELSHDDGEVEP